MESPPCRHYTGLFSSVCMRLNLTSEMLPELTHLTVGILALYHAVDSLSQAYTGKGIVPLLPPLLYHEEHEGAGPIGTGTVPRGNLSSHEMVAWVLHYARCARSLFGYQLMCHTACFKVPKGCQDSPVHISKTRGSDRMHSVSGCGGSSLRFILQR